MANNNNNNNNNNSNNVVKGSNWNSVSQVLNKVLNGKEFTKEQALYGAAQSEKGQSNAAKLVQMGVLKPTDIAWCFERKYSNKNRKYYNFQRGMAVRVNGEVKYFKLYSNDEKQSMDLLLRSLVLKAEEEQLNQRLAKKEKKAIDWKALTESIKKAREELENTQEEEDTEIPF